MDLDASAVVADKAVLPLKLNGRSGEIVRDLYSACVAGLQGWGGDREPVELHSLPNSVVKGGDKDGKKLEKIAKDLAVSRRCERLRSVRSVPTARCLLALCRLSSLSSRALASSLTASLPRPTTATASARWGTLWRWA